MADQIPARPSYPGLRILLNVVGVLCLLSGALGFLPTTWLQAMIDRWAGIVGIGELGPFGALF